MPAKLHGHIPVGSAAAALLWPALLLAGCGAQPTTSSPAATPDVIASVINVTSFDVSIVLSGVLDDTVDTVERTIGPVDSTDVPFVCVDELVVGDPLEPTLPGVTIDVDGDPQELTPFSILAGESFECGDVIEIIVSGCDADTLNVDVFAFTPP